MPLPVELKCLVPGYRARWRQRYACLAAEIARLWPRLRHGMDGAVPWIEIEGGPRLHGFLTEKANAEAYHILRGALPSDLPVSHFRLVKDCLTRFVYPHMRPDLKPDGFTLDQMFGFHGQHKDAIADYPDAAVRDRLTKAFAPGQDDVVIDCGCFLGFGDIRLSQDAPQGRIFAVEADRECYELLCRNLAHNGASNVTPIHRAAWNEETELLLETSFAQANTLVSEVQAGSSRQPVRTISVDGLVAEHGLSKLDMLSLTLNGAEVETLDGAVDTLKRFRPRIRLAGWYSRNGRKIASITKDQLEPLGYDIFVGQRGNVMALPQQGEER